MSGFFEQDVVDLTNDDEADASLSATLDAVVSYKRIESSTLTLTLTLTLTPNP